jgi:perosamine synthetase
MQVPYFAPTWGRPEEQALVRILRSGWITMGREVARFEAELSARIGVPYAVAVNSCTSALHIALVAAGVKPGDRVALPVYTFTASAGSILLAGAQPVFCDIEPETLNIDASAADRQAGRRIAAWMPVDIAGLPADYPALRRLTRKRGGVLIADAAHSLGGFLHRKPVGQLADLTCFSFYANKNLTTAEGGMVVTRRKTYDDRLRRLRLHGMSRDAWKRYRKGGTWYYEIDRHGFKYNQNDLLAALGRVQLSRFDRMQAARARAAAWYDRDLAAIDEIVRAPRRADATHAWHLYIVRLTGRTAARRDTVIEFLSRRGVETSVHFIPLCLQPYWRRRYRLRAGDFPNAVRAYRSAISLPMHPGLSRAQCRHVTDSLKAALVKGRK